MTAPNESLRQYAMGGFTMHLTSRMVEALVEVAAWNKGYSMTDTRPIRRDRDLFIPAVKSLVERGLVVHDLNFDPYHRKHNRFDQRPQTKVIKTYRLTKAGRLMRDLLIEAGAWQELWDRLPAEPERAAS